MLQYLSLSLFLCFFTCLSLYFIFFCLLSHSSFPASCLTPPFSLRLSPPPSILPPPVHLYLRIPLSPLYHSLADATSHHMLSLSLSLPLSLSRPSALCSLIRSASSSPAVSSFAAAEQQLASFSPGSREGKVRTAGRVEEEKVEEDKKEKKRRKGGGGDLLLSIHPSSHPWQQQHQHRCLHRRSCRWILCLLPGSASSFSSGSSSWNWEGEGDHHLPACRGPSARHQEERRKEGEGILEEAARRAEERQHPGLQESREEKKKRG